MEDAVTARGAVAVGQLVRERSVYSGVPAALAGEPSVSSPLPSGTKVWGRLRALTVGTLCRAPCRHLTHGKTATLPGPRGRVNEDQSSFPSLAPVTFRTWLFFVGEGAGPTL